MMKINKLLMHLTLCAFLLTLGVGSSYAASINVDASVGGYEKGQLQKSPVIQSLEQSDNLDDYDSIPAQSIPDPFEPWNRFWFGFNDIFYLHIIRPLYDGYDYVMPDPVQSGLSNFFHNLLFPVRFVSSLLQGKPLAAGAEFSKFMVNTTVGLGGFIDVAKHKKTIVPLDPFGEDMDQTFGVWGFGTGPFIVWPVIGPSSVRGTFGTLANQALDPTFYIATPLAISLVEGGLRFNDLGPVLNLYEDSKEVAVDPYIAMREAYAAYKKMQILH